MPKAILTRDSRFFLALNRFFSASSLLGTTDRMVIGLDDFLFLMYIANSSSISIFFKLAIGIRICSSSEAELLTTGSSFSEVRIRRDAFSVTKVATKHVTRINKIVPLRAFSAIILA